MFQNKTTTNADTNDQNKPFAGLIPGLVDTFDDKVWYLLQLSGRRNIETFFASVWLKKVDMKFLRETASLEDSATAIKSSFQRSQRNKRAGSKQRIRNSKISC